MPNDGPVRFSHSLERRQVNAHRAARLPGHRNRAAQPAVEHHQQVVLLLRVADSPGMPEFFVANSSAPVLPSMPPGGVSTRFTTSGVPRLPPSCHRPLLDSRPGRAAFRPARGCSWDGCIVAPIRVFEVVAAIVEELARAGHERRAGRRALRNKRSAASRNNAGRSEETTLHVEFLPWN